MWFSLMQHSQLLQADAVPPTRYLAASGSLILHGTAWVSLHRPFQLNVPSGKPFGFQYPCG